MFAEEPWSRSYDDPAIDEFLSPKYFHVDNNLSLKAPFLGFVKFYQKVISPLNGTKCSFRPTCSEYAIQAINKHGPILGAIMGSARLLKDHSGDKNKHDPVEENDFWFDTMYSVQ